MRGTTNITHIIANITDISIHVPLAGDDVRPVRDRRTLDQFLSTSPLRGTTDDLFAVDAQQAISIHVPLAGDDTYNLGADPAK